MNTTDTNKRWNRVMAGARQFSDYFGKTPPDDVIILGSGFAGSLEQFYSSRLRIQASFWDFKLHLPQLTVEGHKGNIILTRFGKRRVMIIEGRKHFYENATYDEVTRLVLILAEWGARRFFITNAAGAVDEKYKTGDIVFINDHNPSQIAHLIDSPSNREERFTPMEHIYDEKLTHRALHIGRELLKNMDISCRASGRYLAIKGPDFETAMQIKQYASYGTTLVGMSTIPEVIALTRVRNARKLRHLRIVAVSIVSNMAAGVSDNPISHKKVVNVVGKSAPYLAKILYQTISQAA